MVKADWGLSGRERAEECPVPGCSSVGLCPWACALASLEAGRKEAFLRHLGAQGMDLEKDLAPQTGRSLLRVALARGQDWAVAALLEQGARVDQDATSNKRSVLHCAMQQVNGVSPASVGLVLGKCRQEQVDRRDRWGRTPLMMAAEAGGKGLPAMRLLLDRGAQVNIRWVLSTKQFLASE